MFRLLRHECLGSISDVLGVVPVQISMLGRDLLSAEATLLVLYHFTLKRSAGITHCLAL